MEFKDKFIAFVDVLGFKNMIEAAEQEAGRTLAEINEILSDLAQKKGAEFYKNNGPRVCPKSAYIQINLDFQVTQISDCAVFSSEVSPAGVISLVDHCWSAVIALLNRGIMVRGYVTRGKIYHDGAQFMGTGYQKALLQESGVTAFKREADERGTPFVELDSVVCDYVKNETDACIRKMFDRMVESDGTVAAIFPFKVLAHSFVIGGPGSRPFQPEEERNSNDKLRQGLHHLKEQVLRYVDPSNPRAVSKAQHYIAALVRQMDICDSTDQIIDALGSDFPRSKYVE